MLKRLQMMYTRVHCIVVVVGIQPFSLLSVSCCCHISIFSLQHTNTISYMIHVDVYYIHYCESCKCLASGCNQHIQLSHILQFLLLLLLLLTTITICLFLLGVSIVLRVVLFARWI
jgi:hypothetical protein